jgi:nucleoside-triphosphatase THEP1
MICRELGDMLVQAGGFRTFRDRDENGVIRGYEILSADGYGPRDRFLDMTGERPRIDLEIFSGVGLDYLRGATERRFAVLDEIGGVELLNEDFMNELARYLRGNHPCIGVMKGPGPAGKLVEMMGLTVRYELARRALYEYLRNDPNTLLLEITGQNAQEALDLVRKWVDVYAK